MKKLLYASFCFMILLIVSCSNPCDDIECGPGTCIEGICDCPDGFSGVNCEIQDLCFNVDCGNGTCDGASGNCVCDDGYEGANCEIRIKDKYLGTWMSTDWSCLSDPFVDDLTIRFDDNPDNIMEVYLIDPDEEEIRITTIIKSESFVIEQQSLTIESELLEIYGEGTLIDGVMVLSLTLNFPVEGLLDTCTGTFARN